MPATATIYQFGFVRVPAPAGMPVIDCRIIRNPYRKGGSEESFRQMTRASKYFRSLVDQGIAKLHMGAPCIAVGCSYGKHRSGEVARAIASATGAQIVRL